MLVALQDLTGLTKAIELLAALVQLHLYIRFILCNTTTMTPMRHACLSTHQTRGRCISKGHHSLEHMQSCKGCRHFCGLVMRFIHVRVGCRLH